jgi:tripartite-type tricarboxylate transporter receptor subunit TctC
MPAAVVGRLNAEVQKAAREETVIKKLTDNGTLIATSSSQEMAAMMRNEAKDMAALIKELGLQVK